MWRIFDEKETDMRLSAPIVVITLHGKKIRESAKAILFRVDYIGSTVPAPEDMIDPVGITEWFPFSQLHKILKQPLGSTELDYIVASEWICQQKPKLWAAIEEYNGHIVKTNYDEEPVAAQMNDPAAQQRYEDWNDDDIPF